MKFDLSCLKSRKKTIVSTLEKKLLADKFSPEQQLFGKFQSKQDKVCKKARNGKATYRVMLL